MFRIDKAYLSATKLLVLYIAEPREDRIFLMKELFDFDIWRVTKAFCLPMKAKSRTKL